MLNIPIERGLTLKGKNLLPFLLTRGSKFLPLTVAPCSDSVIKKMSAFSQLLSTFENWRYSCILNCMFTVIFFHSCCLNFYGFKSLSSIENLQRTFYFIWNFRDTFGIIISNGKITLLFNLVKFCFMVRQEISIKTVSQKASRAFQMLMTADLRKQVSLQKSVFSQAALWF